jgi:hypothetical protein
MEVEVTQMMIEKKQPNEEEWSKEEDWSKEKKNRAKKKWITPISSPEFIHVPSTAEKRREAKIARNQQFLKERGLDLSISKLSKLYNNTSKKKILCGKDSESQKEQVKNWWIWSLDKVERLWDGEQYMGRYERENFGCTG